MQVRHMCHLSSIAQWLERLTTHQKVACSIPVCGLEIAISEVRGYRSSEISPSSHIYNIYRLNTIINISWLPLRQHICRTFTLARHLSIGSSIVRASHRSSKVVGLTPTWGSKIVSLKARTSRTFIDHLRYLQAPTSTTYIDSDRLPCQSVLDYQPCVSKHHNVILGHSLYVLPQYVIIKVVLTIFLTTITLFRTY